MPATVEKHVTKWRNYNASMFIIVMFVNLTKFGPLLTKLNSVSATLLSLYQLDKVYFLQSFVSSKSSITYSDNAPTVAPDKVPRNRRLRAGSFLREQQRVAAPSSRVAFACVSLAAAPTATPCFRHWRRSLQLQNPRFRPCAYARGPTSRTFAGETPSPQPSTRPAP